MNWLKNRERLIEHCKPISPACENSECVNCRYFAIPYPNCKAELIADTLLAKGVTAPLCNVGDVLYLIDGDTIVPVDVYQIRYKVEEGDEYLRKEDLSSRCQVIALIDQRKQITILPRHFGTTVFYTEESAEEELAKKNKE